MSFSITHRLSKAYFCLPFALSKQLIRSYDTLVEYFDQVMSIVPKEPINRLQSARILAALKSLDRFIKQLSHAQQKIFKTKDGSSSIFDVVSACLRGHPSKRQTVKDITMILSYKTPETKV